MVPISLFQRRGVVPFVVPVSQGLVWSMLDSHSQRLLVRYMLSSHSQQLLVISMLASNSQRGFGSKISMLDRRWRRRFG